MIFAFLLAGFLITKFWQDTIIISMASIATYTGISTELVKQSLFCSPLGLTVGAIFVGPLNDKFGPKNTFPIYLMMISILNLALLTNLSLTIFRIVLFARSICLAGAINNTYVGTSLLFKGDALPKKTSILYVALFGIGALFPLIFMYIITLYSFKALALLSTLMCILVSYYLFTHLPEKESIPINFATFKTWKNFLINPKFVACSLVSAICIGGFYGFLSIYKYEFSKLANETLNVNSLIKFAITLGLIQAIGRACTFMASTFCSFRLNMHNMKYYLSFSCITIALGSLWILMSGIVFNKIILFGILGFFLICFASGIAQPATKLGLLTIFGNSAGNGQSLVGIGNSFYEVLAVMLVFNFPFQPMGSYLYLWLTVFITLVLSIYFRKIDKV